MIDLFIAKTGGLSDQLQYFLSLEDAKTFLTNKIGGPLTLAEAALEGGLRCPRIDTVKVWEENEYSSDSNIRKIALAKLTDREKEVLGIHHGK